MASVARFDTWQANDGTNVARFSGGDLQVWNGSAWAAPGLPSAVVSGTTGSPTVTSGTAIDGVTYDIYTFKGDGSITFSDAGWVDVVCVGGGGSGGSPDAGNGTNNCGGGAGGQVGEVYMEVTAGTATVTVGAGGAGRAAGGGNIGVDSSFDTFFGANSGGGGGFYNGASAAWANAGGNGQISTTLQRGFGNGEIVGGNAGGLGAGAYGAGNGGGGGGGAGSAGGNGSASVGGDGGDGKIVTIIPSALATTLSVGEVDSGNVYFGGGGGGARWNGSPGSGGLGGGTDGASAGLQTTSSAAANTGGGSGAALNNQLSGNGGSGVVIVRVKV